MMGTQGSAARSDGGYAGIIAIIVIPQVMFSIDFTSANVALASIARDMGIGASLLSWVITGFALTCAGCLILGGRIADVYGGRRSCIAGLSGLIIGELISAAAINPAMLIAGRALTGLSSAILVPASFSLINILLPNDTIRNRAYAILSSFQGVAMLIGLCGGGIVTTLFGWRAAFLINLPLAATALILAFRFIPPTARREDSASLDFGGAALIMLSIGTALLALSVLGSYGWLSYQGWSVLGLAAGLFAIFFFIEKIVRDPLVPPTIFRFPNLLGANLTSLILMAPTGGVFVLMNLLMQREMHFSAMQSGFGMIPYALAVTATGRLLGHSMSKFPLRRVILAAIVIFIAGMLLLATISIERGYAIGVIPGMLIFGMGSTAAAIPLMALSTGSAPQQSQGVATGVLITFQQIGGALGVSAVLAIMGAQMAGGVAPDMAFRNAFLAMAATLVVCLLTILLLTREPKLVIAPVPI
jgi:MFS family permease